MKYLIIAFIAFGCSTKSPTGVAPPPVQVEAEKEDSTYLVTVTFKLDSADFPYYNSSRFELGNRWNNRIFQIYGPFEKDYGFFVRLGEKKILTWYLTLWYDRGPTTVPKVETSDTIYVDQDTTIIFKPN